MNFKTKPVIAGVAAGAVLAAGGIAAIDLSSESAEAQNGGAVTQAELKAANQRSQAAIRKANTLQNVAGKYFYPAGQQVGVNQPPGVIRPQPGTGTGGLPLSTLSEGLQNLQVYSAQYNWNGGAPQQAGRGLTDVQRVAPGTYNFQWPINVSQCVVTASPAYYAGANPGMGDNVQVYQVPGQPNWWQVKYYTTTPWTSAASPGGIALADGPVSIYVQCGNSTTSSN